MTSLPLFAWEINIYIAAKYVLVMAWLIRRGFQEFDLFSSLVLNLPRICLATHENSLGNSKVVSML